MKNNTKGTVQPFTMLREKSRAEVFAIPIKSDFAFFDLPQKFKGSSFEVHKFKHADLHHEDWSDFMEGFSGISSSQIKKIVPALLRGFFESLPEKFRCAQWSWYFSELEKTIEGYMLELSKGEAAMSMPSEDSLSYFLRYLPHFADTKARSYIDRSTGRFGVIVCKNFNVLDIQVREDSDIIFSYATPGTKKNYPSFSGEAVIIDSSDAKQIRKILRIAFD